MAPVKLSVFVGSTKRDLAAAREAVIKAILSAGHIPSGMELWSAGVIPTLPAIKRYLAECDIHVIILGARYGSIATEGISFTEWEYINSLEQGRPVLAFLLGRDEFDKNLPKNRKEQEKLVEFRRRLEQQAMCKHFASNNIETLGIECINSINEAINSGNLKETAGWIRASSEHGQRLREIERNYFLRKLLDRFYRFSTLTKRLDKEPAAKRALGEVFWKIMLGRIKRHGYVNMFFESGSTLAYVSDEFEKKVKETGESAIWKITTNNAIVLLQLLLHTHLDVTPRPAGAPEDYYGAMFDHILLKDPEQQPHVPRVLFPHEQAAVEATRDTLQGDRRRRLYLATASGLELDHPEVYFRGPHVGSHPNMLFKRAIFSTEEPVVLFLTAPKLRKRFETGKCFPVFGPDLSWTEVCKSHKLAICIGYEGDRSGSRLREEKKRIRSQLKHSLVGFDFDYAELDIEYGGAIIVANEGFTEIFGKE